MEEEGKESLCPVCFRKIPAYVVEDDSKVYLEKSCPEHGSYKVMIWNGSLDSYEAWGGFGKEGSDPIEPATTTDRGCPFDCGLCPQHKAMTCFAIIEVTDRCDLSCPVCFADSNSSKAEPSVQAIRRRFDTALTYVGSPSLQLSGGEPTIRDDLPELVSMAKEMGFQHIQINTNGIRIAEDVGYLKKLKDAGVSDIFLQFDGLIDRVYEFTRGRELYETKLRAIENCKKVGMAVILVPALIPGINSDQIGKIIQFAKDWVPTVKGVHFQPISYFGRFPLKPSDENRITIPDLLSGIEAQTDGEIKRENFIPRARRSSHCSLGGFFVLDKNGELIPLTNLKASTRKEEGKGVYRQVRRFVRDHWKFVEEIERAEQTSDSDHWEDFYQRAKAFYLSISAMPFQDVFNIDLERVQNCCTHVITEDKIIPLCLYYMTNTKGERLYGG
jgi:hypothetical protein